MLLWADKYVVLVITLYIVLWADNQVALVADFLWCCTGGQAGGLPCDADTAASAASSSVIVDIVNSHQDGDTANTNPTAAPSGLHLLLVPLHLSLVQFAHKALCMTYAWACLTVEGKMQLPAL